ncbi:hypothetical protein EXIGLDRAFT_755331 [Exidia glandulosa HHB12029]|uniref:ZZ-type domain-containing protein n=1 Tax=Exidia glandulosa HHB12029 TaxID=1314781 RepID=A0A165C569_EXIGL|nr:hypothetical protein EXIGLDRAFT_755331 [Exidia glandulosa HHB12029]
MRSILIDIFHGFPRNYASSKPQAPAAVQLPAGVELRQLLYQTSAKSSKPPLSSSEADALVDSASGAGGTTYACDTCGADCSRVRYHSLKAKMEICASCYADGRFPRSMFSEDFVKLSHADPSFLSADGDHGWTDAETLLWGCSTTIGIAWLNMGCAGLRGTDVRLGGAGALMYGGRLPFEKADNPVMSVVAFLAGAVGPAIASDAASTALGVEGSGKGVPPSTAARLALAASARSAAGLAGAEEAQVAAGVKTLVGLTSKTLELKMEAFEELEAVLEDEASVKIREAPERSGRSGAGKAR